MKNIYLTFLAFLTILALQGQEINHQAFGKDRIQKDRFSSTGGLAANASGFLTGSNALLLKNFQTGEQRLDSLLEYDWNGSDWVISNKQQYTYNDTNLIVEYYSFFWNELTGGWEQEAWEEYSYDTAGNLVGYVIFGFDETSLQWYGDWQREYFYDENNLVTHYVESQKDAPGEDWYLVWKTEFYYNDANKPDSTLEYIYATDWSLTWRSSYIYDENGNLNRFNEFDDDNTGGWINAWQDVYEYDASNRLITETEQEWDTIAGNWVPSDRETYTYQENDNVEAHFDYDWSETDNDWVLSWKEEYVYDNTYVYSQLVLPWFYYDDTPNYMNHQLSEYTNYNLVDSVWVPAFMGRFHFSSDSATYSREIKKVSASFYPNPVTSAVTFKFREQEEVLLRIYNAAGLLVLEQQVFSNLPVNVQFLPEGIYPFHLVQKRKGIIFSDTFLKK